MRFILICFSFLLSLAPSKIAAQLIDAENCFPFTLYLVDNEQYQEAITVIKSCPINALKQDSVNYLLGWSYYQIKEVDSAAKYLNKVGSSSSLYFKSAFYAAFNFAYAGDFKKSFEIVSSLAPLDSNLIEFKRMNIAALYLLMEDSVKFKQEKNKFVYSNFAIAQYQKDLCLLGEKQKKIKKKSALKAALLSVLIPGAGKYYAGYKGKALSTLLPSGILGVLTAEALYRGGLISPPFLVFGTAFLIFYTGNIWGSALSPKLKYNENNLIIKHETLLDWHIALRHAFI